MFLFVIYSCSSVFACLYQIMFLQIFNVYVPFLLSLGFGCVLEYGHCLNKYNGTLIPGKVC